ncbi:hypothetical protein [Shewanella algae]|jgi:hypothetical protein|uniref:hypothetical protein n=2 Tax=Shewanella algae TaxID=38313 RepID=UPI002725CBF5|nr:hypothetical protein [Shewanella algae]MDO8254979.1 hypothetical protein [Shewanella algae]
MHIPPEINLLSPFAADEQPMGPYPSLGFLPLFDAELGNGDYFGLYWPLGRETEAPIVCDMWHDEAKLVPAFSGAGKFVAWLEANDWERGDEEPQDADFAPRRFFAEQRRGQPSRTILRQALFYCSRPASNYRKWVTIGLHWHRS